VFAYLSCLTACLSLGIYGLCASRDSAVGSSALGTALAIKGIGFALLLLVLFPSFRRMWQVRASLYVVRYRLAQLIALNFALLVVLELVAQTPGIPAPYLKLALGFAACWMIGMVVWVWRSPQWMRFRAMQRAQAAHAEDPRARSACVYCGYGLLADQQVCPECGRPRIEAPRSSWGRGLFD
jgi:hypothetical protein